MVLEYSLMDVQIDPRLAWLRQVIYEAFHAHGQGVITGSALNKSSNFLIQRLSKGILGEDFI